MAMYQQWSSHDNSRRTSERFEVDSCSWCGDVGHVYAYCPFVQGDEVSEQVFNYEPSYFSSSNNNCDFYHNAGFSNFNNFEPQPAPPEPFITQAEIDFMHEQSKMNQMMWDQMQTMSTQMAAQGKLLEQLSQIVTSSHSQPGKLPAQTEPNPREEAKAITLQSGTIYEEPPMPTGQTTADKIPDATPDTTRTHEIRPVSAPSVEESPSRVETKSDTDRTDPTRVVSEPQFEEDPGRTDLTRPASDSDWTTHTRPVLVQADNQGKKEEAYESHKAHTGATHGPDTYHTDRALAAWSLHSIPWYFRPPRGAEIHPTHHPQISEAPLLHPSLHVW